jgi:hypothetical protein
VVDYDPLYVAARSVLLDALQALGPQREAVIVVGAQAVYLRTGDADIAVTPYTTDADLVLAPDRLTDEPRVEELMRAARFSQEGQPGSWIRSVTVGGRSVNISVDLMVPEGLAPPGGTRGARIEPHDKMAARKALGLEGAVIDNDPMDISALDNQDSRRFMVLVAGPAALIVAKLHKLRDRLSAGRADRIGDKDAADVYRIMQAVPVDTFIPRLRPLLVDPRTEVVSTAAVELLGELFGARASRGVQMAVEALRVAVPPERVEAISTSFTRQVRDAVRPRFGDSGRPVRG